MMTFHLQDMVAATIADSPRVLSETTRTTVMREVTEPRKATATETAAAGIMMMKATGSIFRESYSHRTLGIRANEAGAQGLSFDVTEPLFSSFIASAFVGTVSMIFCIPSIENTLMIFG